MVRVLYSATADAEKVVILPDHNSRGSRVRFEVLTASTWPSLLGTAHQRLV